MNREVERTRDKSNIALVRAEPKATRGLEMNTSKRRISTAVPLAGEQVSIDGVLSSLTDS